MRGVSIFLLSFFLIAQLQASNMQPGFNPREAREMIQLCNSFTYLDLYGDDSVILPQGYKKEYTSGVFGMDNKFQVYIKGKVGVLNFRGSTNEQLSWMENVKSAMIPAKSRIEVQNNVFRYDMADDTAAAVHSGYMLGLAFLHQAVEMQVKYLNALGIYDIYITGHSQGGSLAALAMVYLDRAPEDRVSSKNRFKLYAFANPMIGNKAFVNEYKQRYQDTGWSISIINPADPIPRLPMSYMEEKVMSPQGFASLFSGEMDKKEFASSLFLQTFENSATKSVQAMSGRAQEQIAKELGRIGMPKYVNDINYFTIGERHEIPPVEYPKILKDSTILKNDSLLNVLSIDPVTGHFVDKNLYKKQPMFYQHKPHNYYMSILKTYFREEWEALDQKYLPENL